MRLLKIAFLVALVLGLSVGAHAETSCLVTDDCSSGGTDHSTIGLTESPVYILEGGNWVVQPSNSIYAKSWNSGGQGPGVGSTISVSQMTNQEHTNFTIAQQASVAQWLLYQVNDTRKDWRVMRPGLYAAKITDIWIDTNNCVDITASGFNDLTYWATLNSSSGTNEVGNPKDTIDTFYALVDPMNAVPADADFVRASDFNSTYRVADRTMAYVGGRKFELWTKINVTRDNNSSEYLDEGEITITLQNMKQWVVPEDGSWQAY